jgi:hypothetical protein
MNLMFLRPVEHTRVAEQKFFWFFFFKKRTACFLYSPRLTAASSTPQAAMAMPR